MIKLIPQPKDIESSDQTFHLTDKLIKVNCDHEQLKIFTNLISTSRWETNNTLPKFSLQCERMDQSFNQQTLLKPESYYLKVSEDGICAKANDPSGLYYAVQTLAQLQRLAKTTKHCEIQCCEITDSPAFPMRIYHDDISRGQVSHLDDFKRILHIISRYKLNVYMPYIEDMLYLSNFPEIGEGRGRLTHEEVREIHATAKQHHIRVIPTFCLLGHCENLLKIPKYSHLGRKVPFLPSSYDVNNPELKPFLRKMIAEVATLFEDDYIHGGFDEVRGLTCKEFCDHVEWIATELSKYGKSLVIFYDMFINHFGFEAGENLPDNVIFTNWNYGDLKEFPFEDKLASSSHDHWVFGGTNNWCRLTFNYEQAEGNINNLLTQGLECGATAAGLTGWGDVGYENQRDINWNIIAYFANQAWNGNNITLKEFLPYFQNDFYGTPLTGMANMLFKISDPVFSGLSGWKLWHLTPWALERFLETTPNLLKQCQEMQPKLATYELVLDEAQAEAKTEKAHIDQYKYCLRRMINLVSRIIAADKTSKLRQEGNFEAIATINNIEKDKLKKLALFYRELWLRHNKLENLDWSYEWYENLINDYSNSLPITKIPKGKIVDLKGLYNNFPLELMGIPKGTFIYDNIPFYIQEAGNFGIAIAPGEQITIELDEGTSISDLNILLAGSGIPYEEIPAMQVNVYDNENIFFAEDLLTRRHLPDWYAPKGNMWAGSANLFTQPDRVKMAWHGMGKSGLMGLFKLSNFNITLNTKASKITFQNITTTAIIHIFSLTL